MSWIKKNWDVVVSYTLLLVAIALAVVTVLQYKPGYDPLLGVLVLIVTIFPLIGSLTFAVVVLARTFSLKASKWRLCWLIPHAFIAITLIAIALITFYYRILLRIL